jgi:quercetin dioxygenase-like cupin family protein
MSRVAIVRGAVGLAAVLAAALVQPLVRGQESTRVLAAADVKEWAACPEFMPKGCQIGVLHGDPSRPNADVFFRVPAGAVIPPHRHTSAERVVLVTGTLEVTYEGEAAKTLRPGTYAYGPANHVHKARCTSGDACTLFIAFEQPVDAIPADVG